MEVLPDLGGKISRLLEKRAGQGESHRCPHRIRVGSGCQWFECFLFSQVELVDFRTSICAHLCMRTTIDLPDSLYRSIKIKATEQGLSLKDYVVHGLEASLKASSDRAHRMEKPPISRQKGGRKIRARSNRELAELLESSGEEKF